MNIKRIPVIIFDMRENMLFSEKKKGGVCYTACMHSTKYLRVLHLMGLTVPFPRLWHLSTQAELPPKNLLLSPLLQETAFLLRLFNSHELVEICGVGLLPTFIWIRFN